MTILKINKRILIYLIILTPYAILGIFAIYHGRFTGDEGWYTLAAINVIEGKIPYRDFLFTQTPLLPYFYGLFMVLFEPSLITGRWLSFLLGMGAIIVTMAACGRKAGLVGAFIGGALLAFNLNFIYDTSLVKTQSLTVFLTAMSLFFAGRTGKLCHAIGSLVCMNLSILTRLSILPALPVLWAFFMLTDRNRLKTHVFLICVNLIFLFCIAQYFYFDGNLAFGIYQFHTEYFGNFPWSLEFFVKFIRGFLSNQFPIILCFLLASGAVVFAWVRNKKEFRPFWGDAPYIGLLFLSYASMTVIHMSRPVNYPTYQTSIIVFAVIFSALIIARTLATFNSIQRKMVLFIFIAALVLSIPFQEFPVRLNDGGSPAQIKEVAEYIKSISRDDDLLLTLSPELATASGLPLLPRYELGEFSYFPEMDNKLAKKLNAVNSSHFQKDISEKKADILCLRHRSIRLLARNKRRALEQKKLIGHHYILRKIFSNYGQLSENLYIFSAKKGALES